jgi:hypothetical protein
MAPFGVLVIIPEALAAYKFNKARKHWRGDAFDDRLTDTRMAAAREEWIQLSGGEPKKDVET